MVVIEWLLVGKWLEDPRVDAEELEDDEAWKLCPD